ncbi:hypothetical protein [Microbulbifer variabilis]|nr:hypothetical protein [Microbulbifer variabilis]
MYKRILWLVILGLFIVGCEYEPGACSDNNKPRSIPFPHAMI